MMNQARLTLNETVPMDPAIIADPYPRYRQMREEDPVHWNQGINCWVLTRYTDGLAALRDQRLSSAQISAFSERLPDAAAEKIQPLTRLFSDIMSDPPNHTRLSKLANKAFTPRVVERMRSSIQATTDVLLDSIEKGGGSHGRFEVIKDLANPLPAIVISEMLGVPSGDRGQFKIRSDHLAAFLGNIRTVSETAEIAQSSAFEMSDYLRKIISQRRNAPKMT